VHRITPAHPRAKPLSVFHVLCFIWQPPGPCVLAFPSHSSPAIGCCCSQVMTDPVTGRSRGFGFVRFGGETERDRAISEMQGVYISTSECPGCRGEQDAARCWSMILIADWTLTRSMQLQAVLCCCVMCAGPIRVSSATPKRTPDPPSSRQPFGAGVSAPGSAGGASAASSATGAPALGGGESDPQNTTIFIGGLSPTVTEHDLHVAFSRYGEIVYTKIPQGKVSFGCTGMFREAGGL
jgi:hypothetical protein